MLAFQQQNQGNKVLTAKGEAFSVDVSVLDREGVIRLQRIYNF
jgi:hypothetical protein